MNVIVADDEQEIFEQIEEIAQLNPSVRISNINMEYAERAEVLLSRIEALLSDGKDPKNLLVLLDLSYPTKKVGLETLNKIKRHRLFRVRQTPVVIYSNSDDQEDVNATYERSANLYVDKRGHPNKFWEVIRSWIESRNLYRYPDLCVCELSENDQPENDDGGLFQ